MRALGQFGTQLMAASRYSPGQTFASNLAAGFEGAQRGLDRSEQMSAGMLGAQQDWQTQQQELRIKALREALPLLTLQQQAQQAKAAIGLADGSHPAAPGGAAPAGDSYESSIAGIEGGPGKNPRSSAAGTGQFIDDTWRDFAAANPDLFKGMTPAQIMAAKTDPTLGPVLGPKAITWLAQRNARKLDMSGVTPTGPLLGIAHYVGAGPAAAIASAPDSAPVRNYVSPEAVQANSELGTMTVGQMKARYANVPNPGFLAPAKGTQVAGPGAPTGSTTAAPGSTTAAPGSTTAAPGSTTAAPGSTPPAAPGSTPPAAVAPPSTSTAPAPSPYPPIKVGDVTIQHPGTFADYRAREYVPPTGEDYNPELTSEQQKAFTTRAQQLQLAQQQAKTTLLNPDVPKALMDITAKQADLTAEQQNAIANKRLAAAAARTKYDETQNRDIQTRYDAQAAAYNAAAKSNLDSQNKINEAKAASTFNTEEAGARAAFEEDRQYIEKMGEASIQSQDNGNQLRQLSTVIHGVVQPGVISSVIQKNPAIIPFLTMAGAISPQQATDTQAMLGMTKYLSTLLRPKGTGSLKIPEMDAFQTVLPTLMESEAGKVQAVAFLQNLNDRIVQQHEFAQQYFRRTDPATGKPAYNLDGLQEAINRPRQFDANGINRGGLGPIVPSAPDWRQGADAMTTWITKNVDVGHPYMGWDYPRDPHSGRPMPVNPKTGRPNNLELQLKVREQ